MNKKIRGLIAFSLVTANMLFTGGSNSFFTTAAYASSDDADEIYELDIEDSDGNSIVLFMQKAIRVKYQLTLMMWMMIM